MNRKLTAQQVKELVTYPQEGWSKAGTSKTFVYENLGSR